MLKNLKKKSYQKSLNQIIRIENNWDNYLKKNNECKDLSQKQKNELKNYIYRHKNLLSDLTTYQKIKEEQ